MDNIEFNIDFINALILFGIFQCALLSYIFYKNRGLSGNIFLFVFAITLMLIQIESFLNKSGGMFHVLFLLNTSAPFVLLLGPLIYLYSRASLGEDYNLKTIICHFLPFVFYFLYSFNFFLQPEEVKYNALISSFHPGYSYVNIISPFPKDPWSIQGFIIVEGICLQLFIYSILSFYKVYKRKNSKGLSVEVRSWIIYLNTILLISAILLFLAEGGIINGWVFFSNILPDYVDDLFGTLCSYVVVFYILRKPSFFTKKTSKYQKSLLPVGIRKKKLEQIRHMMEEDKLYLNSSFSISLLSSKTSISSNHISQIINKELDMSFNELVNYYRINEAKRLLETDNNYIKIEQLAYDMGYKSKSAFFNAFKKNTSQTPSQYRKKYLKQIS